MYKVEYGSSSVRNLFMSHEIRGVEGSNVQGGVVGKVESGCPVLRCCLKREVVGVFETDGAFG